MPNWCFNTMKINGNHHDIEKCLSAISGKDNSEVIDFEKIKPMPTELKKVIACGSLEEDVKLVEKESQGIQLTEEEKKHLQETCDEETSCTFYENAKLALKCKTKHGAYDWYNWACENWGTKWNISDTSGQWTSETSYIMYFETAWSAPEPIFQTLGKRFKNLEFEIEAFEPLMGFGFVQKYQNGKLVKSVVGDGYSAEFN